MVEISNSNDDFEVFNQPPVLEAATSDLSNFPPAQVSQTQEDPIIPDAMVLQRNTRSSLLEIMESQAGGKASKVVGQAKHPFLSPPQDTQPEPVDKKKKWEQKGKGVMEEGRGVPPKEIEPQRRDKAAKTTQIRSFNEGAPRDRGLDLRTKVPN